jgi:hypothetical protein
VGDKDFFQNKVKNDRCLQEYVNNLFNVPRECVDRDFDKLPLNDKNILLIGGGVSPVLRELEQKGMHPKSVTNIDPYCAESPDPRQNHIKEDFMTHDIGRDKYDEIWALYSLPYYVDNVNQVEPFYAKSLLALTPNGKLRVYPTNERKGMMPSPVNDEILREFSKKLLKQFPEIKFRREQCDEDIAKTRAIFTVPPDKTQLNEWLENVIKTSNIGEKEVREMLQKREQRLEREAELEKLCQNPAIYDGYLQDK